MKTTLLIAGIAAWWWACCGLAGRRPDPLAGVQLHARPASVDRARWHSCSSRARAHRGVAPPTL